MDKKSEVLSFSSTYSSVMLIILNDPKRDFCEAHFTLRTFSAVQKNDKRKSSPFTVGLFQPQISQINSVQSKQNNIDQTMKILSLFFMHTMSHLRA